MMQLYIFCQASSRRVGVWPGSLGVVVFLPFLEKGKTKVSFLCLLCSHKFHSKGILPAVNYSFKAVVKFSCGHNNDENI